MAMAPTGRSNRLTELSTAIAANTAIVNDYLISQELPPLSFELDAPVDLELPPAIEKAKSAVLDDTLELQELMLGPRQLVVNYQYNYYVCLRVLYRYQIAQAFPIGEEISYDDLARRVGLDTSTLRRMLRLAMANRIFHEPYKGIVAHSAVSKLMATDELFFDHIGTGVEEVWGSTVDTVPAMLEWPNAQEPEKTGFSKYNRSDKSLYEIVANDPERARRFMNTQAMNLKSPGYSLHYMVASGPWAKLPSNGKVVDMGGSHGQAMMAVAEKYPHLHFLVQDLPATIDAHPAVPEMLQGRVEFAAHDFFTPQPARNADAYFFRWIFHNWPDKYCVRILQNLVPALKPGARIIVNEWVLPEANSVSSRTNRAMRVMDVSMFTLFGSQERDRDEWEDLFTRVDSRFKLVSVTQPDGAYLSILEFVWQE